MVAVYFFDLSIVIGGGDLYLLLRLATSAVFAAGLAAVDGLAAADALTGTCDAAAAAPPGTAEAIACAVLAAPAGAADASACAVATRPPGAFPPFGVSVALLPPPH